MDPKALWISIFTFKNGEYWKHNFQRQNNYEIRDLFFDGSAVWLLSQICQAFEFARIPS